MLWLNNKENINIDFYQIFIDTKIEIKNDKNTIYSLISNETEQIKLINDIEKYKYTEHKFTIRIIDQLISYIEELVEENVFSFKMNIIEPNNNKNNLLIFNYNYKKVNNNRMPNLIKSNYNFYDTLEFKIYKINDKIQFIIETNPKTKIIKKYYITTDLNLLYNFIQLS